VMPLAKLQPSPAGIAPAGDAGPNSGVDNATATATPMSRDLNRRITKVLPPVLSPYVVGPSAIPAQGAADLLTAATQSGLRALQETSVKRTERRKEWWQLGQRR
jgi:hypothetical protein